MGPLSSCHSRDDREGLTGFHGRCEPIQKAYVLVGQEDVDEATQFPGLIEKAVGQAGISRIEGLATPVAEGQTLSIVPAVAGG